MNARSHEQPASGTRRASISVCVCTYKRPELLRRALDKLSRQDTRGRFNYSIVVADNDRAQSARNIVAQFQATHPGMVTYCIEPEQNIALARNKALEHADADFVAFMDDDEFPATDWLLSLLTALVDHHADGVLGPVRPFFDRRPPAWLTRGRFCERPEHQTGTVLHWRQTRTGNVLFRHNILHGISHPFRKEFASGGEDNDFFKRMMDAGHKFVWCNEAVVYEVVPPERWKRTYFLKRALLRGQNQKLFLTSGSVGRSLVAVPVYTALLLIVWILGQHVLLRYAIRLCDHVGKLLVAVGVNPIRGTYLNG